MRVVPASTSPAAPRAAARAPLTLRLYLVCTWVLGWWLAIDGLRQRLLGDYFRIDGQLGPWAALAAAAGVAPPRLALTFIAVGLGLVGASFGVYLRRRWGYAAAIGLSSVSLLYLGFGTPVALAGLILLLLKPTRDYSVPPA